MRSALDLFETTTDGACGVSRTQRITLWNRAAEALLGYPARDVLGHHCYEVMRGTDEEGRRVCRAGCPSFTRAEHLDVVPTTTLRVRTKAGEGRWLSITTIVLPSRWRAYAALVHLFRDVSRYKGFQDAVQHLLAGLDDDGSPGNDGGPVSRSPAYSPAVATTCLTRREQEILRLLASGTSTPEMAEALGVSQATVRNHIHNLFTKLDVHSRLEAVTVGWRTGLL
ncbi:MAG: response regulator transcription factor [Planctomycetota bacterium]|jgi:PAS domain S-box-containing protein